MHDDGWDDEPWADGTDADADTQEISDVLDADTDVCDPDAEALVACGEIEILGRMPWSSNGTYLVTVTGGEGIAVDRRCQGIYKPESGERPLWDFPRGLWRREVAAYRVAREIGWDIVPPTAAREGPLGEGSLQFFVPSHFDEHYFTFKDVPGHRRALEQICMYDIVTNNTDRKGGHVLLSDTGHLWGIDHGLSFHEDFKLRTVMWDFAGSEIPADLVDDLVRWLENGPSTDLRALLAPPELDAMWQRTRALVSGGRFPRDPTGRRYPWPLV